MNEAIISYYARSHKLISESLGYPSLDEENERLYADDSFRKFRVPVTVTRRGTVEVLARDAESAAKVVGAATSLSEDLEDAVQTEHIGRAEEV